MLLRVEFVKIWYLQENLIRGSELEKIEINKSEVC